MYSLYTLENDKTGEVRNFFSPTITSAKIAADKIDGWDAAYITVLNAIHYDK